MAASTTKFDPENPKYKCFFGKIHVTTATKWICYFYFISALLFVALISFADLKYSWTLSIVVAIGFGIDVYILGSGLYAVKKEQSQWLIPYLIVFTFCTIFDGYIICSDLVKKNYEGAWILFDIVNFIAGIWFISIVFRCYQYLNAKKDAILPMSFSNKNIGIIKFSLEDNV